MSQSISSSLRRFAPLVAAAAMIGITMVPLAGAQATADPDQAPPPVSSTVADPPGRVGRLSAIEGTISYQPASDTDWVAAPSNQPITTGDKLWSDKSSHAEVDLGASTIRLWNETELDITRLDDRTLQLRLPQGSAMLRYQTFVDGDVAEVDAPNAAVLLDGVGVYRVDVSADGATTTVTVWSGSAHVTSDGSTFEVGARQVATIRGTDAPTYDIASAPRADAFDQWSRSRDDRDDRLTASNQYVPSDMPGTADLDEDGSWSSDPSYGPIWYPRAVAVGWAPYHNGRWVWMSRWGWTWVDDAPWGWAPFHYGRWAYVNNRWGWCPGRVRAPAVFAPGLVVFVGGPRFGVSVFGPGLGVAWFPLGPEEVYVPRYAVSGAYVRRVNIMNVRDVTRINVNITNVTYRNRVVIGAVTAVPRGSFENGLPVGRAAVRIREADLRGAEVLGAAPRIVPTRVSLYGQGAVRGPRPPSVLVRRSVMATHAPPPAPVPFSVQSRVIAQNEGRPLSREQLTSLRQPGEGRSPAFSPPVRLADAPSPRGETLRPSRPGLPLPRPAIGPGGVEPRTPVAAPREPVAAPVSRPAPGSPAIARGDGAPRSPVARPPVRDGSPSLNAQYDVARRQLEARHEQQFAKPPAGVTQERLSEQQQAEHAQLESRYHNGAAAGSGTLPPPARTPPPAARPQPQKAPQPRAREGGQRGGREQPRQREPEKRDSHR